PHASSLEGTRRFAFGGPGSASSRRGDVMATYRPVEPKADFPALEQEVLEFWRREDIFAKSLALREGAPEWVFYEGPPTANGKPGLHHVEARVFKDIYPRFRTMTGFSVPRKAGWDCHGIPVELEVEKKIGTKNKRDIEAFGVARFNELCRRSVKEYVEEWNRLTERIGFWIDLDDAYWTMDPEYMESVWWALKQFHDRGLLYQDDKVTAYCPRCGTPLSDHEVAQGYADTEDPSIYVRLPILTGPLAGEADLRVARQNGVPVVNPVDPEGRFDQRTGPYAGMYIRDADQHIIEDLGREGLLVWAGTHRHSYPFCWRCDTPLFYYARPAWYI